MIARDLIVALVGPEEAVEIQQKLMRARMLDAVQFCADPRGGGRDVWAVRPRREGRARVLPEQPARERRRPVGGLAPRLLLRDELAAARVAVGPDPAREAACA